MYKSPFFIQKTNPKASYLKIKNNDIYNDVLNFNNKIGHVILNHKDFGSLSFIDNIKDKNVYMSVQPSTFTKKREKKTIYKKYSVL